MQKLSDLDDQPPSPPLATVVYGPHLPTAYIKYTFLPNSGRLTEIIPLDEALILSPNDESPILDPDSRPWVPFATEADFTFAEAMVNSQMSRTEINTVLKMLREVWCPRGSNISFKTYDDMERALHAAQTYIPKVRPDLLRRHPANAG
jgi:hypothetical protein